MEEQTIPTMTNMMMTTREEALEHDNEHMWVLFGRWDDDLWYAVMHPMSFGTPTNVSFNAQEVIDRDEKLGDCVGFLHTHPNMPAYYSGTDDATMKGWVTCLGKPLVCCIKGSDGLRAWWYLNDEDPPEEWQVKRIKNLVFGITPYGDE